MAEYSRLASGQVTSLGGPTTVVLPFIPNYIAFDNVSRLVAGAGVLGANWNTDMGQGAAVLNTFTTGQQFIAPVGQTSSGALVSGTGFTTVQAALSLQYGPTVQNGGSPVSAFTISKASPAVVTTTGSHGLATGNVVVFSNLAQTATTGMQQIAGIPFAITVLSATTFSIPYNTNQANFTAFNTATSTGNVGSYKVVLYPALYAPASNVITAITTGTTTTVSTSTPHNYSVGQEVAFRIPSVFGTTQLNSLPNVVIPGSPIYGFVTSVTNALTFVVNINSTGYTAFNSNQPFTTYAGLKYPQVAAIGDANSGSLFTNFNSPLIFNGTAGLTTATSTINGPAVAGSFVNGTYQGFTIGSSIAGTSGDIIHWRAYLSDINT